MSHLTRTRPIDTCDISRLVSLAEASAPADIIHACHLARQLSMDLSVRPLRRRVYFLLADALATIGEEMITAETVPASAPCYVSDNGHGTG